MGRSRNSRELHKRVLVVTGGVKTEPAYLRYLRDTLGAAGVAIEVSESGKDPKRLVETAVALKEADERTARKNRDPGNIYNAVWVMSDVDDFGQAVTDAVRDGATQGIQVAVSNPCFEIWLLWHVGEYGVGSSKAVQAAALAAGVTSGKNGKDIVERAVAGRFPEARARAQQRRSSHTRNGVSSPDDNPSSGVDTLVDSLLDAARKARPSANPQVP